MFSSFRFQPAKREMVVWANIQIVQVSISWKFPMSKFPNMHLHARHDREPPDFMPTTPIIIWISISIKVVVYRGGNRSFTRKLVPFPKQRNLIVDFYSIYPILIKRGTKQVLQSSRTKAIISKQI